MNWYLGSIQDAITTSKKRKAFFVVYIEGTDELSTILSNVLERPEISSKFDSNNFVAIKLAKGSEGHKQFEEFYKLVPVPSVFFIDQNGSPMEIVVSDSSGDNVLKKLTTALEKCKPTAKSNESFLAASTSKIDQPSTSSAGYSSSALIAAEASGSKVDQSSTSDTQDKSSLLSDDGGKAQDEMPVGEDKEQLKSSDQTLKEDKKQSPDEVKKPSSSGELSPKTATVEERVEKAKILLEKKKEEKLIEEQRKEKEAELERRRVGQELQMAQRDRHERELRQLKEQRERKKREETAARQRILKQIAQDRADRAQRLPANKPKIDGSVRHQTPASIKTPSSQVRTPAPASAPTSPPPSANLNVARLQFKLPSGESKTHNFPVETTLLQVREFIDNNVVLPFSDYQLATTFPRREFTVRDNERDLSALELTPSAVILIVPMQGSLSMRPPLGWTQMIIDLFWDIAQPVITLTRYIGNLIFGRGGSSSRGRDGANSNEQTNPSLYSTPNAPSPPSSSAQSSDAVQDQRLRRTSNIKKRGNIYSLSDNADNDDDNNTWNGNSTQQM